MTLRRGVVLLLAVMMVGSPVVARSAPKMVDVLPIAQQGLRYGDAYDLAAPPANQTPQDRATWLLEERKTLGRTPMDWVGWVKDSFSPGPATAASSALGTPAARSLTNSVLKIYSLVGITPSAADITAVAASAAQLAPNVQGAFGELVATTAAVYAAQVPTAKAVAARMASGQLDPRSPFLTVAERDAMNARQVALSRAVDTFRSKAAGLLPATTKAATPIFSDPEGLVILGGTGNDVYTRSGTIDDPVLLVDLAGNDDYLNSAGGACPFTPAIFGKWLECNSLVVSVVADLGTSETPRPVVDSIKLYNDQYLYDGEPAAVQGAGGPGGIGLLIDVGGDDRYRAIMTRGNWQPFQPILYYFDGGAQGYGYAGVGALVDGLGNDGYIMKAYSPFGHSIWQFGQGFGGAGGSGVVLDAAGDDYWGTKAYGEIREGNFTGVYTQGTGFYGGVGVMVDAGMGNDKWVGEALAGTVDYYAQGFGAFGGLGVLYEDGGDDTYSAIETATSPTPWIDPLLNCAYGTASFGGVGAMIEVAGDDYSYGKSISQRSSFVMGWGWGGPGVAYSAFIDTGGNDVYKLEGASGPAPYYARIEGWGYYHDFVENTFGTFVDIGGVDTYIGSDPNVVGNNKVWPFGVDQSA